MRKIVSSCEMYPKKLRRVVTHCHMCKNQELVVKADIVWHAASNIAYGYCMSCWIKRTDHLLEMYRDIVNAYKDYVYTYIAMHQQ